MSFIVIAPGNVAVSYCVDYLEALSKPLHTVALNLIQSPSSDRSGLSNRLDGLQVKLGATRERFLNLTAGIVRGSYSCLLNISSPMFEPLEVKALSEYRIWIRYADGEEGEVDLSHLAGQGVFKLWKDEQKWKNVRVAEDGAIRWSEEVELCPDAIYLKLTGKSPEEAFPNLKSTAHA